MDLADLIGLGITFGIVAVVGYLSSKQVHSMQDFTLADGKLGRIQTAFSIAATEFGGSSLTGAMALVYTIGLAGAWWDWCAVPAFLLLGIFFAGKIRLPNLVTITDFFGQRYDFRTRLLTSVLHLLAIVTQISAQFMVAATALYGIFGVPQTIGVVISAAFVVLYTIGGGLVAVVNTDVVQFIFVVLSLLIAVPVGLKNVNGFAGLAALVPTEFLSFGNINPLTVCSWIFFCFFTYATSQFYMQRVFAAKDLSTAKFGFIFTGICYFFYGLLVSVIGVCIAGLLPGLSDPNLGYALFIKQYMPRGLAGLVLGGIFAASMSTADSMLLAASTLFVHDVYQPLIARRNDEKKNLRMIRWVTLIVCVLSIGLSMYLNNIVHLMYFGGLFYATSAFFPLVIGLKWKRATAKGAFFSILLSVATGLLVELALPGFPIPSNIVSAAVSLIAFIGISCLDKTQRDLPQSAEQQH